MALATPGTDPTKLLTSQFSPPSGPPSGPSSGALASVTRSLAVRTGAPIHHGSGSTIRYLSGRSRPRSVTRLSRGYFRQGIGSGFANRDQVPRVTFGWPVYALPGGRLDLVTAGSGGGLEKVPKINELTCYVCIAMITR